MERKSLAYRLLLVLDSTLAESSLMTACGQFDNQVLVGPEGAGDGSSLTMALRTLSSGVSANAPDATAGPDGPGWASAGPAYNDDLDFSLSVG